MGIFDDLKVFPGRDPADQLGEQAIVDVIRAASSVRRDDAGNWEYLKRCKNCGEWVHLLERALRDGRTTGLAEGDCKSCGNEQSFEVYTESEYLRLLNEYDMEDAVDETD